MAEIADSDKLLQEIARDTKLREGPAGVATVLRAVKRLGRAPLNVVAREARLPLPVASAVRRELEKAGLLARDGGMRLTSAGDRLLEQHLGTVSKLRTSCFNCNGSGIEPPPRDLVTAFAALLETA